MELDIEKRTLHKISWRIVPFIMLLYFIAYIDRVNIGFAALTMKADLGFTASILGLGAGSFGCGPSSGRRSIRVAALRDAGGCATCHTTSTICPDTNTNLLHQHTYCSDGSYMDTQ